MNYNPILIVTGEPNSVFLEIFFKVQKKYKIIWLRPYGYSPHHLTSF